MKQLKFFQKNQKKKKKKKKNLILSADFLTPKVKMESNNINTSFSFDQLNNVSERYKSKRNLLLTSISKKKKIFLKQKEILI